MAMCEAQLKRLGKASSSPIFPPLLEWRSTRRVKSFSLFHLGKNSYTSLEIVPLPTNLTGETACESVKSATCGPCCRRAIPMRIDRLRYRRSDYCPYERLPD
jgi:hypothetical protein